MHVPAPRDQLKLPLERDVPAGAAEFVRSPSNAEAMAVLERWPDGGEPVLALHGPAGSGKSHLAAIWAERVGAIALHGAEASLADPLELEGRPVLLDRAQDADDETLFHLINLAQSGGGALLLASRPAPRDWATALPDLRSRLDVVRVISLQEPDDTVLAAILRARFRCPQHRPGRRIDRLSGATYRPLGGGGRVGGRPAGRRTSTRYTRPGPSGTGLRRYDRRTVRLNPGSTSSACRRKFRPTWRPEDAERLQPSHPRVRTGP